MDFKVKTLYFRGVFYNPHTLTLPPHRVRRESH